MRRAQLTQTLLVAGFVLVAPLATSADQLVFTDTLQNGWQNWSWATVDFNQGVTVHSGTKAVGVSAAAWEALYLAHDVMDAAGYTNLVFWIHGGSSGGQRLQVQGILGTAAPLPRPPRCSPI